MEKLEGCPALTQQDYITNKIINYKNDNIANATHLKQLLTISCQRAPHIHSASDKDISHMLRFAEFAFSKTNSAR